MNRLSAIAPLMVLVIFLLGVSSCTTNKKITYFKDVPDSLYVNAKNVAAFAYKDPQIQPNDILQISILTIDPQNTGALDNSNASTYSVQAGSNSAPVGGSAVPGFLVDHEGFVELPVIGKIKVGGLTTSAARDLIHEQVARYYKNPVINVRYVNFNITVLGEVARPSTYVVPAEKVSILDAIGMAGDLTIHGRRENVLLIRDSMGTKQMVRFDLNSSSTLLSPYFYLKQGDVIYVEPAKSKIASTDAARTRTITLIASGLSLLIVIATRL